MGKNHSGDTVIWYCLRNAPAYSSNVDNSINVDIAWFSVPLLIRKVAEMVVNDTHFEVSATEAS